MHFAYGGLCLHVDNRADADADHVGTGCTRRHWPERTARQADRHVSRSRHVRHVRTVRWVLLLLAGDVHRYRRLITFQAVAILTVATC